MPDCSVTAAGKIQEDNAVKKIVEILSGLEKPHHDYRPALMWFWNDELREEEISAQLEEFAKKGVNDFFVNATWGMTDEYLGERYFEIVKHTVKEAKRLGLSFWIYDEFNWPSGTAGGQLLRDHPETRAKVLVSTKKTLGSMSRFDELYIKGDFIAAQLVYQDHPEDGAVDVSHELKIEKNAHGFWASFINERSAYVDLHILSVRYQDKVEAASRFCTEEPGYVDALDEKAMRAFIDSTHEKYREAVGEEFGKTVKGLFTDEVCVGSPHEMGHGGIPWNDAMKEKFEARFGYDVTPWLYALVEKPVTAREKQVRCHYWKLVTELVRDAHIRQVYEWCDREKIAYTGHFDGEESLLWCIYQSGDIFELLKWMHIPGIDSIFSRTKINDENFNIAGKIVASAARFFDRDRTMCETYTMSTGQLRFDEMRRVANRLMVLGVNMIQYMGAKYSWDNARKLSDIAGQPSHNYHNSMFKRYDLFGDYVARIQYMSAGTRPQGRVLLLWPETSVCTNVNAQNNLFDYRNDSDIWPYEAAAIGIVNALLEMNIEYDMFSEWLADDIAADNGAARLYGGEYDTVILPNTSDTTQSIMALIRRLQAAGVKIVFADELPGLNVDTAEYEEPFGETPAQEGVTVLAENVSFLRLNDIDERQHGSIGKRGRGRNADYKAMLEEAVGYGKRTLDIRHDGDIYTGLRRGKNADVVFLCNDADAQRTASIAYRPGMQLLDPDTCTEKVLVCKDGRAEIHFDPCQMYVLIEADEKADWMQKSDMETAVLQALPSNCGLEVQRGNILVADWSYAPYEGTDEPIRMPAEDSFIKINDEWVPGKYANIGQKGLLVFDFEAEIIPESVMMYAEYRDVLRCELNGERIDDKWSHCRLWGVRDASLEVAPLLRKGKNRLTLAFRMPDYNILYRAPYVMLRGDFETDHKDIMAKREVYEALPVNRQGYPRFCGDAVYHFEVELSEEQAAQSEFVTLDTREAAELFVNGESVGVRLWAPYRFDTAGLFKAGKNTVCVRLTMPMWNHFCRQGDEIDVGLLGAPKLERKIN
ncbi:MAG: hypothetical protein E7463_03350 [Ruminococcaceae bacterium]|nr:hypothetical protein [Oscillospiraceae bacterium]